jgi:hypothetical protein
MKVRSVTSSGQITIGTKYALKQAQVIDNGNDEILIKIGEFVPKKNAWLYEESTKKRIQQSLEWMRNHPRRENLEEIAAMIEDD